MKINIICVGKIKEKYLQEGINEYTKRISKYSDINIVEIDDEPIPNNPSQKEENIVKKKEAEKILNHIDSHDFVCALDLSRQAIRFRRISTRNKCYNSIWV